MGENKWEEVARGKEEANKDSTIILRFTYPFPHLCLEFDGSFDRHEMGSDRAMKCWDKIILPAKRVWIGISARLSLRKTGLRKLRDEVSTCEYEDVQVMWEMLRRTDTEVAQSPPTNRRQLRKRRRRWIVLDWASYNLCSTF